MGTKKDLTGKRFGRLVVLAECRERTRNGQIKLDCVCDCGCRCKVLRAHIVSGHTKSCGCYQREVATRNGSRRATHGMSKERIFVIWYHMIKRCYDEKNKAYSYYGGRGITVCEEWRDDPLAFKKWALANGYKEDLTIERIDVNGNYCPENCTWITLQMQNYNRRDTRRYKGKSLRIWAKELGLDPNKVISRVKILNWSPEEALELVPYVRSSERYESSYHYKYYKDKPRTKKSALVTESV